MESYILVYIFLGTSASLICSKGFKVNGGDTQECLENGTWSGALGICEHIVCQSIKTPHLQIPNSNTGQSVTIRCPACLLYTSRCV